MSEKKITCLSAKGLHKQYGSRMVVNDVDISVNRNEVVGLLGPNGAGKTTTFYMITGMVKPTKGDIFLDDHKITNDPMYRRARKGVGYLAQEPSIFSKLTVENNLKLVLEMRKDLTKDEQEEKLNSLLDDFSVTKLRSSKGGTLSGGERRRVEIARSLCMDPDFVLLDEPFAGVDPIAVEEIQSIVNSLKERNIGVLITDHNVRETLSITDRSYLLFNGQILKSGTSEDLANDKEAKRLYLGEKFRLD
ncbi:LPS export ABC transporter ATP-binding protein [Candidatus Marinimicrobia bacterium]|nr:LPS export ABC transporter ATP-binding protein [Candidatus Neomarinimicrobiota bacterium]MDB2351261.1 LPS export ABC transporter ATP-binding protein [Candidatus Neomarinimicrobiota bacterium]|tara:strand:- start:915 stop:1658 length:744 start_codon:yes stop_codon:yes gene_type:complete